MASLARSVVRSAHAVRQVSHGAQLSPASFPAVALGHPCQPAPDTGRTAGAGRPPPPAHITKCSVACATAAAGVLAMILPSADHTGAEAGLDRAIRGGLASGAADRAADEAGGRLHAAVAAPAGPAPTSVRGALI